jgi:hypothetical protein
VGAVTAALALAAWVRAASAADGRSGAEAGGEKRLLARRVPSATPAKKAPAR